MYTRDELFLCSLECYFGVYFLCCFATREINTKITLKWAQKQFIMCYFGVYFLRCFPTREINTKISLEWALKQFITQVHTLFSISSTAAFKLKCDYLHIGDRYWTYTEFSLKILFFAHWTFLRKMETWMYPISSVHKITEQIVSEIKAQ